METGDPYEDIQERFLGSYVREIYLWDAGEIIGDCHLESNLRL